MTWTRISRSRGAGLGVLVVAAALLLINGSASLSNCNDLRPVHEGEEAPNFAIPTITQRGELGHDAELSSLRGSIVIIDFWATWCGPCQASMPVLEEVLARYRERGLVVLSINTEGAGQARAARKMANQLAPSLSHLSDTGIASRLYRVTTIPHILILDREGVVRQVYRGLGSADGLRRELVEAIEALL